MAHGHVGGCDKTQGMANTGLSTFRSRHWQRVSVVIGGVLVLGLFVAYAPQFLVVIVGYGVFGAIAFGTVGTAIVGVAITAVLPPLVPISEVSILGRRGVAFLRSVLAIAALFGTAFVGWVVAVSYESAAKNPERFSEVTGQLLQLLVLPVIVAAIVFWMWLSIDLLRIGHRKRANAIDLLVHKANQSPGVVRSFVRRGAKGTVRQWWWIVGAFYVVPLALIAVFVGIFS